MVARSHIVSNEAGRCPPNSLSKIGWCGRDCVKRPSGRHRPLCSAERKSSFFCAHPKRSCCWLAEGSCGSLASSARDHTPSSQAWDSMDEMGSSFDPVLHSLTCATPRACSDSAADQEPPCLEPMSQREPVLAQLKLVLGAANPSLVRRISTSTAIRRPSPQLPVRS